MTNSLIKSYSQVLVQPPDYQVWVPGHSYLKHAFNAKLTSTGRAVMAAKLGIQGFDVTADDLLTTQVFIDYDISNWVVGFGHLPQKNTGMLLSPTDIITTNNSYFDIPPEGEQVNISGYYETVTPDPVLRDINTVGWDGGAYSVESFYDSGETEFSVSPVAVGVFVGLCASNKAVLDSAYTNITYAFLCESGSYKIYVNGSDTQRPSTPFNLTDIFKIVLTKTNVTFYVNGVIKHSTIRADTATQFKLDSSLYLSGDSIIDASTVETIPAASMGGDFTTVIVVEGEIFTVISNSPEGIVTYNGIEYEVKNDKVLIGNAIYTVENGSIQIGENTLDVVTGTVLINGETLDVVDSIVTIDGSDYSTTTETIEIAGKTLAVIDGDVDIDGSTVNIHSGTIVVGGTEYVVDDGQVVINDVLYTSTGSTIDIDGTTYIIDGYGTLTTEDETYIVIDGVVDVDGTSYIVVDNSIIVDGEVYAVVDNAVTITGTTYMSSAQSLGIQYMYNLALLSSGYSIIEAAYSYYIKLLNLISIPINYSYGIGLFSSGASAIEIDYSYRASIRNRLETKVSYGYGVKLYPKGLANVEAEYSYQVSLGSGSIQPTLPALIGFNYFYNAAIRDAIHTPPTIFIST